MIDYYKLTQIIDCRDRKDQFTLRYCECHNMSRTGYCIYIKNENVNH